MFHTVYSCKRKKEQGFPEFDDPVLNTLVCAFGKSLKKKTQKNKNTKRMHKNSLLEFKLFSCWHFELELGWL